MRAVYLKELKLNFTGFTGYLYGAFILLFVGIYTMGINLSGGYAQFEYVLESMAFARSNTVGNARRKVS